MRILYICDKETFDTKMSRVRFHGIAALAKIADVTYSGVGWDNWNLELTVDENIDKIYSETNLDWIIAYRPMEIKGIEFSKVKKCVRYNEMWNVRMTKAEIRHSGADLVVCHHLNDVKKYHEVDTKFVNISHCAEKTIYKDYGLKKEYDVLLTGAMSRHYPFRKRLKKAVRALKSNGFKCKVLSHPGGNLKKSRGATLIEYAKELNKSKIALTCSSKYKYRLGKYCEIPMCGAILAGDLPDEDEEFFKKFMLVIGTDDSDEEIVKKISDCIKDEDRLERLRIEGLKMNSDYTQEDYAKRLLKELEDFDES